ncbi:MAG: hypothetical protein LBU99_07225, partial [Spirochaetaceae bacterium]|nr:hypothetical protein [Spirochaetaceae bacterium]
MAYSPMWAYQGLYLISIENLGERCFEQLAPGAFGRVFLVGIRNTGDDIPEGACRICVEPETVPYQPAMLEAIPCLVSSCQEGSPSERSSSDKGSAEKALSEKADQREALLQFLRGEDQPGIAPREYEPFVASPVEVGDYSVFVCLQLNRSVYESFHRLKVSGNEARRSAMPISLIDALADEYFRVIKQKLLINETGWSLVQTNIDELIKDSGASFLYAISSRARNAPGVHGLFERLNFISSLK